VKKLTFKIQQNYPAPVGFLPEPDFCRIWKKCRILAGAEIRYALNKTKQTDEIPELCLWFQICDFGLAKWRLYSTTKTNSRSQRGTVTHIPPENWRDINAPRTIKFDIYSFGIMLWELFTQDIAFAGGWFHTWFTTYSWQICFAGATLCNSTHRQNWHNVAILEYMHTDNTFSRSDTIPKCSRQTDR